MIETPQPQHPGCAPLKPRGLRPMLLRAIERASGMGKIMPLYEQWSRDAAGRNPRMMNQGLAMLGARLNINAPVWPPQPPEGKPVVIIANHPFGIGDGIAMLVLAEDLGRPYRVLLNTEFLRVPEVRPLALPIDFSATPEALETNLRTRKEARELMQEGVTMVIFPAGGVATARLPWGKAEELPWKTFAARLIQMCRASVLPVFFEGQNSALFHAMSRLGPSLRMSLLAAEFRRFAGREIKLHVGPIMDFEEFIHRGNRNELIDELYVLVHRLAPGNGGKSCAALKPPIRANWSWDSPLAKRRREGSSSS